MHHWTILSIAAIFLVLCATAYLAAQELSNNELFIKANELYQDGEYDNAVQLYERIVSTGLENGYLFYNLGNAYFKQGSIGKSILHYEKARKFLPRDKELAENIVYARAFLQDRIEEKNPPFIAYVFSLLLGNFTLREIAACASLLLSVTLVCALFLLLRGGLFLKNLTITLLVVFVLSGLLLAAKLRFSMSRRGVVISELAEIKSAPSEGATVEFIIHEGTDFQIIQSIKEWVKIRLRDGKTGWTTVDPFEEI